MNTLPSLLTTITLKSLWSTVKTAIENKGFCSHQSFVEPVQMIINQTPAKFICKLAWFNVACEFIGRNQNHLKQRKLTLRYD